MSVYIWIIMEIKKTHTLVAIPFFYNEEPFRKGLKKIKKQNPGKKMFVYEVEDPQKTHYLELKKLKFID